MAELPQGTVTFLFTDIEGSTRLLHELGDHYASVLMEHRSKLRVVFNRHHGVEVGTEGDSFFVAFSKATDSRVDPSCIEYFPFVPIRFLDISRESVQRSQNTESIPGKHRYRERNKSNAFLL